MHRTTPRLPLKRKTPLRAKKGINKMSDRAKEELKIWRKVTSERQEKLMAEFCFIPCEYCHQMIQSGSDLFRAEGHHNNKNRRDNLPSNCRILHRYCNQIIEDKNIRDIPSLLGDSK